MSDLPVSPSPDSSPPDSSTSGRQSTVNLVRSSHPWTEADSAAGFVLKYLVPMRRILTDVIGNADGADSAIKLLLGHLVTAGFGDHQSDRLRDFLLRGVRSAAKTANAEISSDKRPTLKLDVATLESKTWLSYWREALLERAWRALERLEHANCDKPLYTVLIAATSGNFKSTSELAAKVSSDLGKAFSSDAAGRMLTESRTTFAQLVADEIAETIQKPTTESVKREIAMLGLGKAFTGISI